MRLLHEYHDVAKSACHQIDEIVILDAVPSITVGAIERYLDVCGNVLDVVVPLGHRHRPEAIAIDAKIAVDRKSHRNKSIIGRFDDRLEVFLSLFGTRRPFFAGRFTVRPLGVQTELQLKGRFTIPPSLVQVASFGGTFDPEIIQETIRAFLRDLKPVIETEYETLKSAYAPLRRIDSLTSVVLDDLLSIS